MFPIRDVILVFLQKGKIYYLVSVVFCALCVTLSNTNLRLFMNLKQLSGNGIEK